MHKGCSEDGDIINDAQTQCWYLQSSGSGPFFDKVAVQKIKKIAMLKLRKRVSLIASLACLVVAIWGIFSTSAFAGVIVYDNLSDADPFYNHALYNYIGTDSSGLERRIANSFTPSQGGFLDELWLGILDLTAQEVTLALHTDNSGQIGTEIWKSTFTGLDLNVSILHLSGLSGPKITAGTVYWLVASKSQEAGNLISWHWNNTGATGNFALYKSTDGWSYHSNPNRAMRISVSVPEPSFTLLLSMGLTGICLVARLLKK